MWKCPDVSGRGSALLHRLLHTPTAMGNPKRKGKPLNPKSPLTETEQRGLQVRVNREVEAAHDFNKLTEGGMGVTPKKILKAAARRRITEGASRRGTQRILETRRRKPEP